MPLTPTQMQFLLAAAVQAKKSGHIFPEMAACEAALESAFGTSLLAVQDNNLFGMKQHQHPIFGTQVLPTREFERNQWVTVSSNWIIYPDWASCFADRMRTLERLSPYLEHYKEALEAPDAESYVRSVSASWSTDPNRANKVIAIYNECAANWDATA